MEQLCCNAPIGAVGESLSSVGDWIVLVYLAIVICWVMIATLYKW